MADSIDDHSRPHARQQTSDIETSPMARMPYDRRQFAVPGRAAWLEVLRFAGLGFAMTALPGCAVVGGIFKAGVWVGVLAVVLVLGVAFAAVMRLSKR
jgi:hypothetical protein